MDENGNPLPTGKPVISGLKIDRNSFGCFRIKDIALKVYDINEPYAEFYGNKVAGLKAVKMQSPLQETTNFFALDEKEFKAHSLVNISLDPAFNDVCLDGSPYNYTKWIFVLMGWTMYLITILLCLISIYRCTWTDE